MTNSMSREQLKKIIFDFRCEIDYDAKGIYIGEGNHEWGDEEDNKLAEAIWNAIPEVNIPSIEEMSSKYPQKGKRKNEPSFNPMASPTRDKRCEHKSREIITIALQTWEWCRECGNLKYDNLWHAHTRTEQAVVWPENVFHRKQCSIYFPAIKVCDCGMERANNMLQRCIKAYNESRGM